MKALRTISSTINICTVGITVSLLLIILFVTQNALLCLLVGSLMLTTNAYSHTEGFLKGYKQGKYGERT